MPTVPSPSYDAALETRVFWERFKTEIIAALIIVMLAIIGFGAYRFYIDRKAAAASALLASAKSADAYQQVIADYPNTPAAADAYLLLAEAQRGAPLAKGDDLHPQYPRIKLAGAGDIGDGQHEMIEAFDLHGAAFPR